MDDFFKYLTLNKDDIEWGLYLTVSGKASIPKAKEYPLPEMGHPTGYNFQWEKGRILSEYQIHYFTEGEGTLETDYGRFKIVPGSIMITFPGVWHRFKPSVNTGWVENYIGFNGNIVDQFFSTRWFKKEKPIINCGTREEIIDIYYKIFTLVNEEVPNFQLIASGMIVKLLGYIVSIKTNIGLNQSHVEKIVNEVKFLLRENVEKDFDFEEITSDLCIGYSYFRRMFKKHTGISPKQYHLQLKIMRAKDLLINSDLTIKEIAKEVGFKSVYYFSRIFKEKTSKNPSEIRKGLRSSGS